MGVGHSGHKVRDKGHREAHVPEGVREQPFPCFPR